MHTFVKLLSIILITSYHAFANAAVEITYDTEDVINSFERNPVGINLNSLTDKDITTEALSSIKVKSLRFPMGEMSDWMIFDKNNPDVMGVSIQDPNNIFTSDSFTENNNSIWKYNLGFNKFIEHCQTLKAEPYVVIGIDALKYTGSYPKATKQDIIQAAKDWVEYANITQKYNVNYWEIGNENDLPTFEVDGTSLVTWTPAEYGEFAVEIIDAMKSVDPSIKVGVNGMTTLAWWDELLPIVNGKVDFAVTHQYSSMRDHGNWWQNAWPYTGNLVNLSDSLKKHGMDIPVSVTENSSFSPGNQQHWNNTWKALHNLEMFGYSLSHKGVDQIHMWTTTWFNKETLASAASAFTRKYDLVPMGWGTKIWGEFVGKNMLKPKAKNSIRTWATHTPDTDTLSVMLLNKNPYAIEQVNLSLNNFDISDKKSHLYRFSGDSDGSVGVKYQKINSPDEDIDLTNIELPPFSFTILQFTAVETHYGHP